MPVNDGKRITDMNGGPRGKVEPTVMMMMMINTHVIVVSWWCNKLKQ